MGMVERQDRFGEVIGNALREDAWRCRLPPDFTRRLLRACRASRQAFPRWARVAASFAAVLSFSFLSFAAVVTVPALAPVRETVAAWFAEEDNGGTGVPPVQVADVRGTGVPPVQEESNGGTGVPPVQEDNRGTGVPPVQSETVFEPKQEDTTLTQPNTTVTRENTMNTKKMAAIAGATMLGVAASVTAYASTPDPEANSAFVQKVSVEDFDSCVPHVKVSGVGAEASVEFQSSRSTVGPWTTFETVTASGEGVAEADNDAAVVGVLYYYRVVVASAEPTHSSLVAFTRFRRLERDPAKETGGFINGYVQIMEQSLDPIRRDRMPLAFDGKTSTISDTTLIIDGATVDRAKVGVDFGEAGVFFAGGRCYPRYTNNNTARSNGAYFSAANDASFADGVTVSGTANFNNQPAWLFMPSTDTAHPYRYVWLWKNGSWYANVAEVQFYGWTQKDIDDSGLVIPPDAVTLARGAATGSVVVGWSGGANVTSFAVERRVAGENDWTTAASGLPATDTSWTDEGRTIGATYEYRVVANGKDGDSMATPSVSLYVYKTGDGTGLRAVLHGPIASPSYQNKSAGQCVYREFRTDAAIDFNTDRAEQTLYAQTNLVSALVHWRGKLIVPEDGDYTLGLEVKGKDGYSIWVDNEEVANNNCRAGKERVGLSLESGEHPIRIEWASRAKDNVRVCRLTWACAGKFAEEVIPMTQLKPETDEATFPCYMVDGYNFALPLNYDADIYLPRMERTANGDYTIYCQATDLVVTEPDIGMTVKGPFRAEVTLNAADSTRSPRPQLVVRRVSDGRAVIGFISRGGTGAVNVKAASSNLGNMNDVTTWFSCKSPVRLRIDRDRDKTLHFYYKGADQTAWTECFTFIEGTHYMKDGVKITDRATLTDDSLRVSFGAAGGVDTGNKFVDCHSHGFTVKPRLSGLVLFLK